MANETKKFPLRITDKKVYPALAKEAKLKKWSVNTLINTILENSLKKVWDRLVPLYVTITNLTNSDDYDIKSYATTALEFTHILIKHQLLIINY